MSAGRFAAAALAGALLAAAASPAAAQNERSGIAGIVQGLVGQLERVMAARTPPPDRPPPTLQPCNRLYSPPVLEVAQGPELAATYDEWLLGSYAVMREVNGELPLPICFRWRADVVDTNLGRYLLNANSHFIRERYRRPPETEAERRFYGGYLLTGYLDPAESDTALARRRADLLLARLPGVPCQYEARGDESRRSSLFYRKVYFTYRPVIPTCPRAPH
ncbi:MAG: hypothetical protein ACJ8GN_14250 [Longimicrobiaceae bacterium]